MKLSAVIPLQPGYYQRPYETASIMTTTLAKRLGTTTHLSPLMQKAKRLGVHTAEDLERIAIERGLRYFGQIDPASDVLNRVSIPDLEHFSNEELATALMSPSLPYSLNRIRMGAAMLAADGVSAEKVLRLARLERTEAIVRHIAESAERVEPGHPLWKSLLQRLPSNQPLAPDILPHPSRFVAMSGLDRTGRNLRMQWIRPLP